MDTISKNDIQKMLFDEQIAVIESNEQIAEKTYKVVLVCDTSKIEKAGQFINILIDGFFLRRPISISDYSVKRLTIIFRIVGDGTAKLAKMAKGDNLNILIPLGNGYDIEKGEGKKILLVGGGIGVPPLLNLAKKLKKAKKQITVVMGFNNANEIFYEKEFFEITKDVRIATVDGSKGIKGFVTDAFDASEFDYYYACGPEPMLKALLKTKIKGQLSYEARMGCGFGACMGCTCQTKLGNKRICIDGPIMESEELQ